MTKPDATCKQNKPQTTKKQFLLPNKNFQNQCKFLQLNHTSVISLPQSDRKKESNKRQPKMWFNLLKKKKKNKN